MAKEKVDFLVFRKDCKFRTYQDQKCVHDKNKKRVGIGSCKEELCPLKDEPKIAEVAPAAEAPQEPGK